jgi:hypothetical protein
MPIVSEKQERKPRHWLPTLALVPVVLLLTAVAFLAWLPSQGAEGVSFGKGTLMADYFDGVPSGACRQGLSIHHASPADAPTVRLDSLVLCIGPRTYFLHYEHWD